MAHLPKVELPADEPLSIRASIAVRQDSISGLGPVLIKDTTGRISLAPARAFLIRWLVALTIGCLLLAGARVESLQAMPRDNTTGPASREVTDETGRSVRIPQPVRRIVSLAPSVTETLFALGLGDRIVGDTDFCDYPPEAKQKTAHRRPRRPQYRSDCGPASGSGGRRALDQSAGFGAFARAVGHPRLRHGPAQRRAGAHLDRAAGRIARRR